MMLRTPTLFVIACAVLAYLIVASIYGSIMLHARIMNNKENLEGYRRELRISFVVIGILFAYIMYYLYV